MSDKLNKTIYQMNNIILASEINNDLLLKPIFEADTGYVNLITDPDGITRSIQGGLNSEINPFAFEIYYKVREEPRYRRTDRNIEKIKLFLSAPEDFIGKWKCDGSR